MIEERKIVKHGLDSHTPTGSPIKAPDNLYAMFEDGSMTKVVAIAKSEPWCGVCMLVVNGKSVVAVSDLEGFKGFYYEKMKYFSKRLQCGCRVRRCETHASEDEDL